MGDVLYFANGAELWRTDGTQEGTVIVRGFAGPLDLGRYGDKYSPRGLVEVSGRLFFLLNEELWGSDGTASGTRQIWATTERFAARTTGLVGTDRQAFFFANTPRSDPSFRGNLVLWVHDPATGDTRTVGGAKSQELWATDALPGGTTMVKDLWEGGSPWDLGPLVCAGGSTFLATQSRKRDGGSALLQSDGTAAGTRLVREWTRGGLEELIAVGERLFFSRAGEGDDGELWTSDGTAGGTREVTGQGSLGCQPRNLTPLGTRRIVFTCGKPGKPWVSDGTPEGTSALAASG